MTQTESHRNVSRFLVFNCHDFFPKDTEKYLRKKRPTEENRRKNGKLFGKSEFAPYDKWQNFR